MIKSLLMDPYTEPLYMFSPGFPFCPVSCKDISTSSEENQLRHHHRPMLSRERAMLEKLWDRYYHPAAAANPIPACEFNGLPNAKKDSWCLRTNLAVAELDHGWLLAWKFIHMTLEYNTWHKIYHGCHAPIPDKDTAVTDGGTRHLSC